MLSVWTLTVALAIVTVDVHPADSAPAYVRRARNATRDPECVAFPATWDSCCDILRLMTNHTRTVVSTGNSTTAVDGSFNTTRPARQVKSTNLATKPDANNTHSNSANKTDTAPQDSGSANTSSVDPAANTTTTTTTTTSLSGVYNLNHYGPFSATYGYCDMEMAGGGWLVIFRREDSLSFDRPLQEYEDGFGSLEAGKSFWYGLKALSHITSRGTWELRVDLVKDDEHVHAHYGSISVGDASEGYILRLGAHVAERSNATDSLQEYDDNMFFTRDNDNENKCARSSKGGWWFTKSCGGMKGGVLTSIHNHHSGWYSAEDYITISYHSTELKIRQLGCNM